jgi:preprotein translocase subunit SecF
MEYSHELNLETTQIATEVSELAKNIIHNDASAINATSVYKIAGENTLVVIGGFYNDIEATQLETLKNDFRSQVLTLLTTKDADIIESKYINIGKSFGDYIRNTAFLTL